MFRQMPGIRVLFIQITRFFVIKVIKPNKTPNHQIVIFDKRKWLYHYIGTSYVNMFRFEQNGRHVADGIFKLI